MASIDELKLEGKKLETKLGKLKRDLKISKGLGRDTSSIENAIRYNEAKLNEIKREIRESGVGEKAKYAGKKVGKVLKATGGGKVLVYVAVGIVALLLLFLVVIPLLLTGGILAFSLFKGSFFYLLLGIFLLLEIWLCYNIWTKTHNLIAVILVIIILLGINFFAWRFYTSLPGATPTEKFDNLFVRIGDLWKFINPFEKIRQYQKKYEATLTGDYFTGQVDQNKNEPIGVYLENVKAADPAFYVGEPVAVWATLKAKVLDENISVNVSCKTKDKKGVIIPTTHFDIDIAEEEDLECEFDSLDEGTHKVTFDADFNFKTMAYLKNYFIDKIRLRSMLREGLDVLGQYGITDKNPVAVYSNGPVGIGIGTKTQPIGINTLDPGYVALGVTLENRWDGGIKRIKSLEIKVPEGLEMRKKKEEPFKNMPYCGGVFDEDICYGENSPVENCEDGYNLYRLKNLSDLRVETFTSLRCYFDVDDATKLLGTTPIATRYFKVTTEYDYRLNKSTVINVRKLRDNRENR